MRDVEVIYFEARELPPEDRAGYLAESCGDDPVLRARVEQMLALADEAEAFITDPADGEMQGGMARDLAGVPRTGSEATPDELVGEMIGRYKILERIGEGGCGVVYVAEQTKPVRRRVALKLIKLGMDSRQVVSRFEAERQALAKKSRL